MRNKINKNKININSVLDGVFTHIVLIIVCFIFFFPCLWLLLASFSDSGSIYSFSGFFPSSFSFNSYKTVFLDTEMYNYPIWFTNTLFISIFSAIIGTTLLILTAYTMSRFKFKGRKSLMKFTLILGMFPSFMGMTAVYLLMTQFGLINNHWGLILIYSAGAPMGYMVQKGFFDTLPNSIDEAARIDGANNLTIFLKISLPLSKPFIVYTLLMQFSWPWSDFILPKLLLKEKNMYTVAVGLMSLGETEFSRFAAGSIFIAIPVVVLYFALSRFMINGMSAGAVKE